MTRVFLAATAALTLIAGAAMAQTSSETTTTTYTPVPVPAPVSQTVTQHTVDANGNEIDRSVTTGTTVSPYGAVTTVKKTTETTTTVR